VLLPVRDVCPSIELNRKQSNRSFRSECTLSPSSSTSSSSHTPLLTRVSRLYGNTARAIREAAIKRGDDRSAEEGLFVAEMEWLSRTRSSRIRFGDGLAVNKQNAVDVRVDEFLKSTNGRYVRVFLPACLPTNQPTGRPFFHSHRVTAVDTHISHVIAASPHPTPTFPVFHPHMRYL
jgi:hypothetical protein